MTNATVLDDRAGRGAALAAWGLYLLSIPSAGLFALVGVVVAYLARDGASPWAQSHFEAQIRVWWIAFAWAVGLALFTAVSTMLTIVLIGFPLLWLAMIAGFVVMVWFTLKSLFGLLRLLNGQAM